MSCDPGGFSTEGCGLRVWREARVCQGCLSSAVPTQRGGGGAEDFWHPAPPLQAVLRSLSRGQSLGPCKGQLAPFQPRKRGNPLKPVSLN